ncbi:MAG: hypothetical protein PF442_10700 [Desulfobulbaceae bacterium]|jgi:co-chaperonin GroES (HSP10)|nr:hypothetical protein [Desulfobulbaceae bacterium]
MTSKQKAEYQDVEVLRSYLQSLQNQKFQLDCGHHVTFGHFLGNDVIIYNGKELKIICSQCGF